MISTFTSCLKQETSTTSEVTQKLAWMRQALQETGAAGIRLRGNDWFAWATAGGDNTVLLAAETGVAEVLVTPQDAWIMTDEIEAPRLQAEQVPGRNDLEGSAYQLQVDPWANPRDRQNFVREATQGGPILSDRPTGHEQPLPAALIHHKRVLLPDEIERYRQVGQLASAAMTEVLSQAQPEWTEYQLAGAGAEALWARGLHPALTLAAGERRLPLYRHPIPSSERLNRRAMLVFCARGYGLIVSLTRFVCFGALSAEEAERHRQIAEIEAIALNHSQPGTPLSDVYAGLAAAYTQYGYSQAIREHHQGGTAGYLAREVIATPDTRDRLAAHMVVAWNPSLPGAKIEDTFVLTEDHTLENLSLDPNFPQVEVAGRQRPIPMER